MDAVGDEGNRVAGLGGSTPRPSVDVVQAHEMGRGARQTAVVKVRLQLELVLERLLTNVELDGMPTSADL